MPTSGTQTTTGKAFEFACALSLQDECSRFSRVAMINNSPLATARGAFESLPDDLQQNYVLGAAAAVRIISRLEPRLSSQGSDMYIRIQADSEGIAGDVRDVLCLRGNNWEIGLSCKHNHEAVKHSRLSDQIDFGHEWFSRSCSHEYMSAVRSVFWPLRQFRDDSRLRGRPMLWDEIPDKEGSCYVPVLNAFMEELIRLDRAYPGEIPAALIRYLIGTEDFYKVIMNEQRRFTKIESININGTLNQPDGRRRALIDVPQMRLPTRFYEIGYKPNSRNTIVVVCDEGWNVSMRIHNASSRVEPSLKFDVQLMAMPSSILTQIEPW